MKKIASLLLAMLILCTLCAPVLAEEEPAASGVDYSDGEIHWTLSKDLKTLTISGHGNMKNYPDYDYAPWNEYDAYETVLHIIVGGGISRIGSYAFAYFYNLESIELSEGIQFIEDYAFYESPYYTSIDLVIPSTVFYIGQYAFGKAMGLKNVYIKSEYDALPNYVKGETYHTVKGNKYPNNGFISSGNIKADGIYIEEGAFYDCQNIETLAFGNFKKHESQNLHIGKYVFDYCYKLKTVYFSDSLAFISEDSFYKCSALNQVYYFGENSSFKKAQIGEKNNPDLIKATNMLECMPYIDTYCHDADYHWHDTAGMPLFYDEKQPHNFVKVLDDKYKKDGSEVYYYKTCSICGQSSKETFSIADPDIPGVTHMTDKMTVLDTGCYIVDSKLDFGKIRLLINGDVKLILLDGCGITTSGGINVGIHKKLTVYSESIDLSEKNNMGYIKVTGAPESAAGIGSDCEDKFEISDEDDGACQLIINGGNFDVRGGYDAAGIGSGEGADLNLTINNGRVLARGGFRGAGIGSGNNAKSSVTINGGYVEGHGGFCGAGIGSGNNAKSSVTINGGYVEGHGGNEGAGIGCGSATELIAYTMITINGGTVKAWGGEYGFGIGRGASSNSKYILSYNGNPSVETHDHQFAGLFGSMISGGNLWIVIAVAIVAIGSVTALVIVKKKKKKSANANSPKAQAKNNL